MPINTIKHITDKVGKFSDEIEGKMPEWCRARTPVEFRELELNIAAACRRLQDEITEAVLRTIVSDGQFQAEATVAAREGGLRRSGGRREVKVVLLGGKEVRMPNIEYLKENHRQKRKGRCRTKRGKSGIGVYPVLATLGIAFGVTPALGAEICQQVAESDSVRAARASLARRDIDLGHKQTLRIVNCFSGLGVAQRASWLERAQQEPPQRGVLSGKRVSVGIDGGRLRLRVYKPGRRRKSGHRSFDAVWREPKLFVIYVLDNQGKVVDEFRPVYDATMGDSDAVFPMLAAYLRALGASEARELVLLGDGAEWIWNRATQLVADIGIDPSRLTEVVDWSHAAGKLHKIADIPKNWKKTERVKWLRQARKLLEKGRIDELIEHIETLAVGSRAQKVRSHEPYFTENAQRMQYSTFRRRKVPCGSGCVESAIRRVINLRMKSNAKYWCEVNAEGMLLFRSYLKAGRFNDLFNWLISYAVEWWPPAQTHASSPIN
jgi:hypothetical protein